PTRSQPTAGNRCIPEVWPRICALPRRRQSLEDPASRIKDTRPRRDKVLRHRDRVARSRLGHQEAEVLPA
ncbi:Transposon Tf2-6 polyprotein, partial [Caligus rogercresseyi]